MKNTKVLDMLNNGEIEQLKQLLMEEIYKDSLKGKGNAKDRYAAMKRYFKYVDNVRECCNYPCKDIEIDGKLYNSFLDGVCFALTTDNIDTMETFDKTKNDYVDIVKFIDFDKVQSVENINLNHVLAEAKSKGYKYSKKELNEFNYVLKYKDGYFKISLLDKAFSIVNDGELAKVYYKGNKSILLIKTSIGIAGVLPFHNTKNVDGAVVISIGE